MSIDSPTLRMYRAKYPAGASAVVDPGADMIPSDELRAALAEVRQLVAEERQAEAALEQAREALATGTRGPSPAANVKRRKADRKELTAADKQLTEAERRVKEAERELDASQARRAGCPHGLPGHARPHPRRDAGHPRPADCGRLASRARGLRPGERGAGPRGSSNQGEELDRQPERGRPSPTRSSRSSTHTHRRRGGRSAGPGGRTGEAFSRGVCWRAHAGRNPARGGGRRTMNEMPTHSEIRRLLGGESPSEVLAGRAADRTADAQRHRDPQGRFSREPDMDQIIRAAAGAAPTNPSAH